MRKIKVLMCGRTDNMKLISEALAVSDIDSIFCDENALDVQRLCLTEELFAIMIMEESFNYGELIEKLSEMENPIQIYIIQDPFSPCSSQRITLPNVHYIENMFKYPEIADMLKFRALEIFKECYITREKRAEMVEELVHEALTDLCFTANYIGTSYIHKALVALCMSELKSSDSMCHTIYPYIADDQTITVPSIERSIRTVIKRCWAISGDDVHVKYFGFVFSNKRGIPTNREFIMILADTLTRELHRRESALKLSLFS